MKLDILVFAAHPDDAELSCSGTMIKHIKKGQKVGIIDLTKGEMGTRGTPEIRQNESDRATEIMGLHIRENLDLGDVYFEINKENKLKVVEKIRKYQPKIILANAISDRHPDHGKGAQLVQDAQFWSGLRMIETVDENGNKQTPWRAENIFHYIQSNYIKPDFVVNISDEWEQKIEAIRAFKSQFFTGDASGPQTFISTPSFMKFLEARAREYGQSIRVEYGEGFTKNRELGIEDLDDLI